MNGREYQHRRGTKKLRFTDESGAPLTGREITVKQIRHKFLFGCSEFSTVPYAGGELTGAAKEIAEERYDRMLDIFNYVTLPFYWGRFEPEKGRPDTERLMKAAKWLKSKGCELKGHTLCWHTVAADWLMEMNNGEVYDTLIKRIDREVGGFKGLIDIWDVINEAVIMPIFDKYDNAITKLCKERGRVRLVRDLFDAARKANPKASLLINDFDTSKAYDILIDGLLESGVRIDAIGIQSHMHQGYWGTKKTEEVLERFSRFKLPLHFTENTLVSGRIMPPEIEDLNDYQTEDWPSTPEGEERQAAETAMHYKTLFKHPSVHSITWWSFNDGLWLNAPSGLVTRDSKAKPAYTALHELIKKDWWTGARKYCTDENGEITAEGFFGEYEAHYDGVCMKFSI